jgi:hypothetical protein
LLAGEQQRDIDGNAGEDRLLDCRQALPGAGYLDEEVGPTGSIVEGFGRRKGARRVVASKVETSRDTQPSTPSVRSKIS